MGSEFDNLGQEPGSAKISINSSQFVDYVVSQAADQAEQRVEQRNASRRTAGRWIAAILGLIAVGGVGAAALFDLASFERRQDEKIKATVANAIKNSKTNNGPALREEVDRAVERAVESAVNAKVDAKVLAIMSRLDGMVSYQQLLALSTQLEIKDSFSDEDRDLVLAILTDLKARGNFTSEPGFKRNLKKIVDSFTSAYQVAAVDKLDDLFRQELSTMEDVPRWMTNHLGRVLATSREINEQTSKRWERLRHYSDVTKQNRSPEISLLWNLISEFVLNNEQRTPKVDTLVAQIGHLVEKDRKIFMTALLEEGTASEREPPDMRRLAQIVTKLVTDYQQELTGFGLETE